MGIFRFKRFNIINERSAMKVNTDGVLLGASMLIRPEDRRLLDVGTGTGTIALMAAQRLTDCLERSGSVSGESTIRIEAIDIDAVSVDEARDNFKDSPWSDLLDVRHCSLSDYEKETEGEFDLVFSNPPYFDSSLQAPDQRRSDARHTSTGLSYRELLEFAGRRLAPDGRISMVLPADVENELCRHARMCGLHLFRIMRIRTVPRKAPGRIVAEFCRERTSSVEERSLVIQNEGKYTEEYLSLTHDFYLFS